jgi:DNA-binding response OmpR family regulator
VGDVGSAERKHGASIGDLYIDDDARSIKKGAAEVFLTPKEHGLLHLLQSQPGHLFTKEEITESVWHHRYISSSRTLEVHVRRLRNKLRSVDSDVQIQTIRAIGYRMWLAK